jgi:hypothetical protein
MKTLSPDRNKLYCFSPEVMLATFLIEVFLAIYVFVRYRMTNFGRISIGILLLLAGFQIVEYQICTGVNSIFWSRLGFVIITLLPVLGVHLIYLITGKNHFLKFGYALMTVFVLNYAFAENALTSPAFCTGNYIIFYSRPGIDWLYVGYYSLFLFLGIWEAAEGFMANKQNRIILGWTIMSYAVIILPTAIISILSPITRSAIPSIMCGFALILAFILTFKVVPLYHKSLK